MKPAELVSFVVIPAVLVCLSSCATSAEKNPSPNALHSGTASAQVPSWSPADLDFFLHGSMSTEIVPERMFRAFIRTYPDLFPNPDLSHFGLIPALAFGWPVGFSRRSVAHLGSLPSVGINCAACHVTEITAAQNAPRIRI